MPEPVKVLAIAGSLRTESYNRKLLRLGVEALRARGAEVDELDMRDIAMPLFDQDIEDGEGPPPGAIEFRRRIALADGLLMAVPEYNSSIPGGFKNALDWASRGEPDVLRGKVGAIMSASPGGFGGIRMNPHLRQVLRALGVHAIFEQVTVARANQAFDEAGRFKEGHLARQVDGLADALITECRLRKLAATLPKVEIVQASPSAETSRPPGGREA